MENVVSTFRDAPVTAIVIIQKIEVFMLQVL